MDTNKRKNILRRIEHKLSVPSLADKLANDLSASDLNSLLTEVFAKRAENISPVELLKLYSQNGYAKPAACDAVQYRRLEADMLAAAEKYGITSVILSPASLFGCCSAFGAVSQNKIISSTRNLEILSDATNMLALHIASGIKDGSLSHANSPIHLCATHRHIRYQPQFRPGMLPHFGIFSMVSAGKSGDSYTFETGALLFQLKFYQDYWLQRHGSALSITFNRRKGYKDPDGFFSRAIKSVIDNIDIEISIDEQENETAYYKGLQATINALINGEIIEIGDMGFTDWTQKLLNNKSERLLVSAMALDRQMPLLPSAPYYGN